MLDVGCGRGEFLGCSRSTASARAASTSTRRWWTSAGRKGWTREVGDALTYLRRVPGRLPRRTVRRAGRRAPAAAIPDAVPRRRVREAAARRANRARDDQPGVLVCVLRELRPRHHARPARAPGHAEVPARRHRIPATSRSRYRAPYPESEKLQSWQPAGRRRRSATSSRR